MRPLIINKPLIERPFAPGRILAKSRAAINRELRYLVRGGRNRHIVAASALAKKGKLG
jgi:hypothetical protein